MSHSFGPPPCTHLGDWGSRHRPQHLCIIGTGVDVSVQVGNRYLLLISIHLTTYPQERTLGCEQTQDLYGRRESYTLAHSHLEMRNPGVSPLRERALGERLLGRMKRTAQCAASRDSSGTADAPGSTRGAAQEMASQRSRQFTHGGCPVVWGSCSRQPSQGRERSHAWTGFRTERLLGSQPCRSPIL